MPGTNPRPNVANAASEARAGEELGGRISPAAESPKEQPGIFERDVQPPLPTSGQILGILVKRMGLSVNAPSPKTVHRYFSGQRVKEASKAEILADVAQALQELGLIPNYSMGSEGDEHPRLVESALRWHTAVWDSLRSFLRPRMPRVQPSHLGLVWTAYLRLASIDLALRVAASLHVAGAPPDAPRMLDWLDRTRRGQFLNQLRKASGVSLEGLAAQVGVTDNALDAWMYDGVRPSDQNLMALATSLSLDRDSSAQSQLLAELRQFYWASDLVELVKENLNSETAENLLERLRTYARQILGIIDGLELNQAGREEIAQLAFLGSRAPLGGALLARLATDEEDKEWREDLTAASGDWATRVLTVIHRIHQAEVATMDDAMDGGLLQSWDVSSPKAYLHYQKSRELQIEGKTGEALHEVARAIELDPLDPANHFTMGSMIGSIGYLHRDPEMVKRGLEECRLAAALDPEWILPWAEIGYILIGAGRPSDAVAHLLSVPKGCGPLEARYYTALALAHQALGNFSDALAALKQALRFEPEDLNLVLLAGIAAVLNGEKARAVDYVKEAHHLGAVDLTTDYLQQAAMSIVEQVRHPATPVL